MRDGGGTLAEAAAAAGVAMGTASGWDGKRRDGTLLGEAAQSEQTVLGLQNELARTRKKLAEAANVQFALEKVIGDAVAPLANLRADRDKPKPKREKGKPSEVAFLFVSDAQAGQLVRPEEVWGLNEYGIEEFRRRTRLLTTKTLDNLAREQRSSNINEMCVLFGGDIIEGEGIFPGQQWEIDAFLMGQLVACMDEFSAMLARFAEALPQVTVYTVPGNHGRNGRKGESTLNFDTLLYTLFPRFLANHKNIRFIPDTSPVLGFEKPRGQVHVLTHGDKIKSWNSIPYYGIDRAAAKISNMAHIPIDCLWIGHHHAAASMPGATERIVNGSFVGTSKYGFGNFIGADIPRQWLIGWSEEGRSWQYDLRLAKPRRLVPDADGVLRGEEA